MVRHNIQSWRNEKNFHLNMFWFGKHLLAMPTKLSCFFVRAGVQIPLLCPVLIFFGQFPLWAGEAFFTCYWCIDKCKRKYEKLILWFVWNMVCSRKTTVGIGNLCPISSLTVTGKVVVVVNIYCIVHIYST